MLMIYIIKYLTTLIQVINKMYKPLSKKFLLQRGQCCGKRCINCPYTPKWKRGTRDVKKKFSTDR